jgi:hypothetical protein
MCLATALDRSRCRSASKFPAATSFGIYFSDDRSGDLTRGTDIFPFKLFFHSFGLIYLKAAASLPSNGMDGSPPARRLRACNRKENCNDH